MANSSRGSGDGEARGPRDHIRAVDTGDGKHPDEIHAGSAHDACDAYEDRSIDRFRRGAAGTVLAAGLLGLRDALEGRPERDEPAIVTTAPDPLPDDALLVVIDFEHPERSRAVVRRTPGS